MLQSMVLQSWTRLSNWTELTSEKNHLALERSWEPSIYIWRWSSRLRLWQHSLLADDQKSGMKTGKRWCKRNPGRKEFREVKEGYQGWYLRSAEINPSCGQLGLAFRSSVQQVQGSVEVQRCHSLHLPLSVTLGSLPVGFRFLSPRWAALGQEPVVLTSVTPAPHTHTHPLVVFLLLGQLLSRVWPCSRMDCSPPGSSVHGVFPARTLEWVAISYSRGSSRPKDWSHVPCVSFIVRWILYC